MVQSKGKLLSWETPFAAETWPSVHVSLVGRLHETVVHVESLSRWQIRFKHVVGVKISDETYDGNARFHIPRERENLCSYIWNDSEWLKEISAEYAELVGEGVLRHYVLLGGDNNVEILAVGDVTIEQQGNYEV